MKTEFTIEAPYIGRLSALITTPSDHDPAREKLPVILFLHGSGESGDSSTGQLERVRAHGIPKYFAEDPDHKNLRVITVSPQCPDGLIWEDVSLQTMELLDKAIERFGGDKDRVSVTGLSMGGFGTWHLITTFPERFYRAAPICGGGVSWRVDERLSGKEIRVYHSVEDPSVPFQYSALLVEKAQKIGADISFTSYCGEGHGCWSRAYEDTDLIEWLSGQGGLNG